MRIFIFIALFASFVYANIDLNSTEKDYIKTDPLIRVCYAPDWFPLEFINKQGHMDGMTTDFINVIFAKADLHYKAVPSKNWDDTLRLFNEKKCDILASVLNNTSHPKSMNLTQPYVSMPPVIVTHKDTPFIENPNYLAHKEICILKGDEYEEILLKKYPDIRPVYYNGLWEGLKMVQNKKCLGFVTVSPVITYGIQAGGFSDLRINSKLESDNTQYSIGVQKDMPLLYSILNKAVNTLSMATRAKIYNKWISVEYAPPKYNLDLILKVLAGIVVIALAILIWNRMLTLKIRKALKLNDEQQIILNYFEKRRSTMSIR